MRTLPCLVLAALPLVATAATAAPCIDYGDHLRLLATVPTAGRAYGVTVSGAYAYVAAGAAGLAIYDLASLGPDAQPVGSFDTPGDARRVTLEGSLAYVADFNGGLQIIDVSDPSAPGRIGEIRLTDAVLDVAISGHYAYIAAWLAGGFQVVDIANPAAPVLVASRATAGYATAVAIEGTLAYCGVSGDFAQSKLITFNVTNPANPVPVVTIGTGGGVYDLTVRAGLAYLAAGAAGLRILDVSVPSAPVWKGTWNTPSRAAAVELSGDIAYVADEFDSGLEIVDVSDPMHPVRIAHHGTRNSWGVAVDGARVLVSDIAEGLKVFSASPPSGPSRLGAFAMAGGGAGAAISGDHMFVAVTDPGWGLRSIDISDPLAPHVVAEVSLVGSVLLAMHGNIACVTTYDAGGIALVDVSDPEAPVVRGVAPGVNESYGIAIRGDHAFVGSSGAGLQVFDIAKPDAPSLVASLNPGNGAYDVAIAGTDAYVTMNGAMTGLGVIDISNPLAPVLAGFVAVDDDQCFGVAVRDGYAYVAGRQVTVIDVSDAAHPTVVHELAMPWEQNADFAFDQRTMYVGGLYGMTVVDITFPGSPRILGEFSDFRYSGVVEIHDDVLYSFRTAWPEPSGWFIDMLPLQCRRPRHGPPAVAAADAPRLVASPNPARRGALMKIGSTTVSAGPITIYDVHGRVVRRLAADAAGAWDGRDDGGKAAPAGVYFARAVSAGRALVERVVLMP